MAPILCEIGPFGAYCYPALKWVVHHNSRVVHSDNQTMDIKFTERFLRDLQSLPQALAKKCYQMISGLHKIKPARLPQVALPGWRLHGLRGSRRSNMVSLSVDMNFRVLAQRQNAALILHRVVKHDLADRDSVNRNNQADPVVSMTTDRFRPSDVYSALLSFGIAQGEADPFRMISTEDDLLDAAAEVSAATADLALRLYETSELIIPQARFRVLHKDEDFTRILDAGGTDWETYLHPSQAYLVEFPPSFRTAVVGSAGTGKTVCAWYRTKYLIESGVSVGFVCPHKSVLDISKDRLLTLIGDKNDSNYFFVPGNADELIQLVGAVDHLVIDEAQEIHVTWLAKLAEQMPSNKGITLFYDINQLGGNIRKGDVRRYRDRISSWKTMLCKFPRLREYRLTINYRNALEIAEYYLDLLSDALPTKPLADIPLFESGEVVQSTVNLRNLIDILGGLMHRLLKTHSRRDIGIVTLNQSPKMLIRKMAEWTIPVTDDPTRDAIVIANSTKIRGHERQVMIIVTKDIKSLRRSFGHAINAYVAMSRAIKLLIVIEASDS